VSATLAAPPLHRRATEPTLASLLEETWVSVTSGASVECPVCAGPMQPRWSAGAGVVGGRCEDCGTTLE
jgi:tRNA(Ile2) C34 agmatinyltransferase TiaS